MTLSIAFVNAKPGTGKTTSAVWLAHAFVAEGYPVFLVDADPAKSALEWSDVAGSFPFRVAGLPFRDLHQRVPQFARDDEVVIIDSAQLEDNVGIARSALRLADEVIIPCTPSGIEVDRTVPMRTEIEDINVARSRPARAAVLFNRTVARANSTPVYREQLERAGLDVLPMVIPGLELYKQSFLAPVVVPEGNVWRDVVRELLARSKAKELAR